MEEAFDAESLRRAVAQKQEKDVMSDSFGRCPLCGGGKRAGTTTFAVDLKFGVVVVRDVPALVCEICGEAWIDDPIAAKLESAIADARRKQAVVEVMRRPLAA